MTLARSTHVSTALGRGMRHAVSTALVVTATLSFCGKPARAADPSYPVRPIKVVVPFPAGAGADGNARLISQKVAELLKQPVVVENRPGANGMIGTDAVAKADPDGYTVLFTDRGALGINPSLYRKLPYDPNKDFDFVGIAVWGPYVLVANPKTPFNDLAGLAAYARTHPGKVNYASFGNGSMPQLGSEMMSAALGISMTHVPYKGGAPALTAVMAGEVDVTLATIGPALGALREGRLKAIFVGSAERSALMPGVPTAQEAGLDLDRIPATYFGFALPAGASPKVIAVLSDAIRSAVSAPALQAKMLEGGFIPATVSPVDMRETVRRDVAEFGKMTARLGIQPE